MTKCKVSPGIKKKLKKYIAIEEMVERFYGEQ